MTGYARAVTALAVGAALAVAGCSSTSKGTATTSPSRPTTTAATSEQATTSAPAPSASETVSHDAIVAVLMTPDELGPSFTAAQFQPADNPLPCTPNAPALEEQFPPTDRAGTAMVSSQLGASASEEIELNPDTSTAQAALAYVQQGLNCSTGQLALTGEPQTFHFGHEQDVTNATHADQAIALQADAPKIDIVLVACRVGRAIVLFAFLKTPSTPLAALPDPLQVVARAIDRIP